MGNWKELFAEKVKINEKVITNAADQVKYMLKYFSFKFINNLPIISQLNSFMHLILKSLMNGIK